MTDTTLLNDTLAAGGAVRWQTHPSGRVLAQINTPLVKATIDLLGAQILSWQPAQQSADLIWTPEHGSPQANKPWRGGIPICWPWFGPHPSLPMAPAHGLARNQIWEPLHASADHHGAVQLGFRLHQSPNPGIWPYDAVLDYTVDFGATLKLGLSTHNIGEEAFNVSEALHTYFQVADIEEIVVSGLEGVHYVDKLNDDITLQQNGDIRFQAETDRVYQNATGPILIHDLKWGRTIRVDHSHAASAIVWNPWQAKAERLGDLGTNGWRHMICVESGNALDRAKTVLPGQTHTLSVRYSVI